MLPVNILLHQACLDAPSVFVDIASQQCAVKLSNVLWCFLSIRQLCVAYYRILIYWYSIYIC